MNRREAERLTRQRDVLVSLGFTPDEAEALRRISMTLHRWHELECGDGNGYIERDEKTGRPYWYNTNARYVDPRDPREWRAIPDREAGAKRRLAAILKRRNGDEVRQTCCAHCGLDIEGIAPFTEWRDRGNNTECHLNGKQAGPHKPAVKDYGALQSYIQTDPRGAALYILRPGDVPEGEDASAYYSRGVCVY